MTVPTDFENRKFSTEFVDRFERHLAYFKARAKPGVGANDCWGWEGPADPYGLVGSFPRRTRADGSTYGKSGAAHRFSYWLYKGPLYEGFLVLHSCDNPPCCNPRHLSLGTTKRNAEERSERGRQPRGEGSVRAKLTDEAVRDIRARYVPRKVTLAQLAADHRVDLSLVYLVVKNRIWRHVQ